MEYRTNKRREFGYWIKSVRNEKGFTLKQVSERLGYKSRGTIVGVETGYTCLPVEKIHPLAYIYGMDFARLLEKIQECEPELYRKYQTLARDIIKDFAGKVMSLHNSYYRDKDDPEYILSDSPRITIDPRISLLMGTAPPVLTTKKHILSNLVSSLRQKAFRDPGTEVDPKTVWCKQRLRLPLFYVYPGRNKDVLSQRVNEDRRQSHSA